MDEDTKPIIGESSSNHGHNRSLSSNHANNSSTSSHNSSTSNHKPSASNSSHKQQQQHISNDSDMSLDGGAGDDLGWWECSLCTYRNSADKFKCEICDLRRGTSTRKPRCNADTIVAQVVKQQEQIRQQTRAPKTPKSRSSTSTTGQNSAATSSTDTKPKQQQPTAVKSKAVSEPSSDEGSSDETSIYESSSESSSSSSSAASAVTSTKASENPFKLTPLEVNGNLIKYSPPTSSGRTGLIIDKKKFTQHSVTVNDVTITFTEFATRQNRYIRKKKKRRENRPKPIGNGSKT